MTTEEEWKEKLTDEQYHVLREKGTEIPFTGDYIDLKDDGMYHCAGCGAPLFSSDTKFESHSGWPSFTGAVRDAVRLEKDSSNGMERTEVVCAKCDGHLGHVFDDGPQDKGGKRFCINSCALDFNES